MQMPVQPQGGMCAQAPTQVGQQPQAGPIPIPSSSGGQVTQASQAGFLHQHSQVPQAGLIPIPTASGGQVTQASQAGF